MLAYIHPPVVAPCNPLRNLILSLSEDQVRRQA